MKGSIALFAAVVAVVVAEPPVDRQYLPPTALSAQYGPPGSRSGIIPSARYGAPSAFGLRGSLSSRHGGPALSGAIPSTQYGVPSALAGARSSLSSRYGPPSFGRAISTQYGAPSAFSGLGVSRGLSTEYGVPAAYDGLAGFNGLSVNSRLSTQYGAPAGGYAYGRGGEQYDPLAEPANYEFNYAVEDAESGSDFGHEERRQDENAQGQYRVLLPDGRLQIVDYEADQEGFKPSIRYEETGLGAQGYARGPAGGYINNGLAGSGYAKAGRNGAVPDGPY